MSGKQPRVSPEALSWCISQNCLDYWESHGQMLGKAHQIEESSEFRGILTPVSPYHRPTCGAAIYHTVEDCIAAPHGWPACRNCTKRAKPAAVPPVFYGLEQC